MVTAKLLWVMVAGFCSLTDGVGNAVCYGVVRLHVTPEFHHLGVPRTPFQTAIDVARLGMDVLPDGVRRRFYLIGVRRLMKYIARAERENFPGEKSECEVLMSRCIGVMTSECRESAAADTLLVEVALDDGRPRNNVARAVMGYYAQKYRAAGVPVILALFDPLDDRNVEQALQLVGQYADRRGIDAAELLCAREKRVIDPRALASGRFHLARGRQRLADAGKK